MTSLEGIYLAFIPSVTVEGENRQCSIKWLPKRANFCLCHLFEVLECCTEYWHNCLHKDGTYIIFAKRGKLSELVAIAPHVSICQQR
jgi:hypothetical protein